MSEWGFAQRETGKAGVEAYLTKQVHDVLGGKAYKWNSPGNRGVPDRIVLLPGGWVLLVETKAPGKNPRPSQIKVFERMFGVYGQQVTVVASKVDVDRFVGYCRRLMQYPNSRNEHKQEVFRDF